MSSGWYSSQIKKDARYPPAGREHSSWRNLRSHFTPPLGFTEMGLDPRKARRFIPRPPATQQLSQACSQVSQLSVHLSGSQLREMLPHPGQWSGDIFGCHQGRVQAAAGGWRPRMVLSIPQCTGQCPQPRIIWPRTKSHLDSAETQKLQFKALTIQKMP